MDALGWSYLGKGMYQKARAAFEKELGDPDRVLYALAGFASVHAYAGEMTEALKRVMELKA